MRLKLVSMIAMLGWASACAAGGIDWPTYGFDSVRSSDNPLETTLGPDTVGGLTQAWNFLPGAFDATLTPPMLPASASLRNQAIVASGVTVQGLRRDLVLFGDNNGSFFALDATSGAVVWSTWLGFTIKTLPKVTIMGVFGTAALDRAANGGAGVVYAASHSNVFALDLATGRQLTGWPVSVAPNGPPSDGSIHTGINVVNGQLYVTTGSSGGEQPIFFGRVVQIDGAAATVVRTWYTLGGSSVQPTLSGGGIWGWGGVAVDPSAAVGGVYAATGNTIAKIGQFPNYAEQVVNLSPALDRVVGFASPAFNGQDNDYGATPTIFQPRGCAGKFLAVKNKTGLLILDSIAPAGDLTMVAALQVGQPMSTAGYTGGFRGTLAWDAEDNLLLVTNPQGGPAPYAPGLIAFGFDPGCAAPYLSPAWQMPPQDGGAPTVRVGSDVSSPTVANGVAYFGAGALTSGTKKVSYIYAVATATTATHTAGELLWQSPPLGNCTANNAPTVVNGRVIALCTGPTPSVHMYILRNK